MSQQSLSTCHLNSKYKAEVHSRRLSDSQSGWEDWHDKCIIPPDLTD